MKETQCVLVLLKNSLSGSQDPIPNDVDWKKVIQICVKQQIYMMVFPAVKQLSDEKRPSSELYNYWYQMVLVHSMQISKKFQDLYALLDDADKQGLKLLLLKGIVTRDLYPVPEYRTMGDIDIYCDPNNIEEYAKFFIDHGYTMKRSALAKSIEYDFTKEGAVSIELFGTLTQDFIANHYNKNLQFRADDSRLYTNIKPFKNYKNIYQMTNEWHVIYWCLHFAKHFFNKGSGIRNICDYYVFKNLEYDKDYVDKIISEYGLTNIMNVCKDMSKCYFEGINTPTEHVQNAALYLLTDGVYGDMDVNSYAKSFIRNHGAFKYLMSLAFPPLNKLKNKYPILNKCILLLPFCWIAHAVSGIFRHHKSIKDSFEYSKTDDIKQKEEFLDRYN